MISVHHLLHSSVKSTEGIFQCWETVGRNSYGGWWDKHSEEAELYCQIGSASACCISMAVKFAKSGEGVVVVVCRSENVTDTLQDR